jgi:hypothetical protein
LLFCSDSSDDPRASIRKNRNKKAKKLSVFAFIAFPTFQFIKGKVYGSLLRKLWSVLVSNEIWLAEGTEFTPEAGLQTLLKLPACPPISRCASATRLHLQNRGV